LFVEARNWAKEARNMSTSRNSRIFGIIFLAILICIISFPAYSKYSGRTSDSNNPYQITMSAVVGQEFRLKLSTGGILGPNDVVLIANGDFENGKSNWSYMLGDMSVGGVPAGLSVPVGVGNAVARASMAKNNTVGMYSQLVSLKGNTAYVLSAYIWILGNNNHKVDVAVVDLDDAGLGSPYGIWEGQLTLSINNPGADGGYFVYSPFRTAPNTKLVTVRIFYTGLYETDDDWPYYPIGVMWDNIAITPIEDFPYKVSAPPLWPEEDPTIEKMVTNSSDINCDNQVNFLDVSSVASNWLGTVAYSGHGQIISIEAEHYAGNTPTEDSSWVERSNINAGGDRYMQCLPDKGSLINTDNLGNSPNLSYLVDFETPGIYYVWIRGRADSTYSDSVYYGINGQALSLKFPIGNFSWNLSGGRTRHSVNVSESGIHRIDLWMQEDGIVIDRILITNNIQYDPATLQEWGHPESNRDEILQNKSDIDNDGIVNFGDFSRIAEDWNSERVDASTLTGKVMCGYQGWFNCPDDGAYPDRGWTHYERDGKFEPGYCSIDFWPDVSEFDKDERFATAFKLPDGNFADVYSSRNRKTIDRHFRWMREYRIDGVFLQRFAVSVANESGLNHCDTVLRRARESANKYGRVYAVMYDLSGLGENGSQIVIEDWKHLVDDLGVTHDSNDRSYLHHRGKPVVGVWGIGFNDGRQYTLDECKTLVQFFKNDSQYGGLTVMVGVPSYWRTLNRDCMNDPKVHEVINEADIVCPWAVGRYSDYSGVDSYCNSVWIPDMEWCKIRGKDYLPVIFPGFSWGNMQGSGFNSIPRREGQFLWRQFYRVIGDAKVGMVYQAMFDEVDEGTAIFKCTSTPAKTPVWSPGSVFLDYEGLPSDYYLWLVGQGGKMLRGEIPLSASIPSR
jgi:hypothetical protein